MKQIVKEYPITKVAFSNALQLYRLPISTKSMNIAEVRQKPVSKLVELKVSLPPKNTSILKIKTLNIENLAYRAFPSNIPQLYWASLEDGKIFLYSIQNIYLFQPFHFYSSFEYLSIKLKKAESREELEHRMRSINYRLKNVELEEFQVLLVENSRLFPKLLKDLPMAPLPPIEKPVNLTKLEETIKRTKIVNFDRLLQLFPEENIVKSALFRMTDMLNGRFILKNQFYERSLHEIRNRLVQLFGENESIEAKNTIFLGEERWMLDELAYFENKVYRLKGHKEVVEFTSSSIKMATLSLIRDLFIQSRILTSSQIGSTLSINENFVLELLSDGDMFFHLANDAYALNDDNYILNEMFRMLVDQKSFELFELTMKLEEKNVVYDIQALVLEIKKYCSVRSGRYYLKSGK